MLLWANLKTKKKNSPVVLTQKLATENSPLPFFKKKKKIQITRKLLSVTTYTYAFINVDVPWKIVEYKWGSLNDKMFNRFWLLHIV